MPYTIFEKKVKAVGEKGNEHSKYLVLSSTDRVIATHKTKESAEAQAQTLNDNEPDRPTVTNN